MKARYLALALVGLAVPSVVQGAGVAYNDNFIVLAPDQLLAEEVLAKAEHFRQQVAEEWLAEELPPRMGRATVNVELSDVEDENFTWAIDSPEQIFHKVWLTTTRRRALGSALGHEITHVVFATRFPDRLPSWIEEGAASLQDDPQRIEIRQRIIRRYARTGNWPRLETLFKARTLALGDQPSYSVAASVTQYLLCRGGRPKLLRFAVTGQQEGWNQALREHYGIPTVRELQAAWQAWASRTARPSPAPTQAGRFSAKTFGRSSGN